MILIQIILGWVVLLWIETSFITSLPWMLATTPLLFTVSLYLYQHHGFRYALVGILAYALFLDIFHLGIVPLETISYFFGVTIAWFSAKRWFSHRSFYGVLATTMTAYVVVVCLQSIILGFEWIFHPEMVSWGEFSLFSLTRIFMMILLSLFLFPFVQRLQTALRSSFFVARS